MIVYLTKPVSNVLALVVKTLRSARLERWTPRAISRSKQRSICKIKYANEKINNNNNNNNNNSDLRNRVLHRNVLPG